jgi:pyruvate dehydrogenase E2 component (dihydrolipoamide acetyltransferase)
MAEFIVMPKLGFDMREGVLNTWIKEIGDEINKGDVIAEIESDKATLELEAQATGTLLQFLAEEGDVVPIGGNLAVVGQPGEDLSKMVQISEPISTEEETAVLEDLPTSEQAKVESSAASSEFPGGFKATPVARRIADEHGLDLKQVNGSGPGGRIRKADVEEFLVKAPAPLSSLSQPSFVPASPDTEAVSTSRLRQAIGRRMAESKTSVPHFYVTTEIDMGPSLGLRKEVNAVLPDEEKVTVNDMIVKGAALTLKVYPNINSSFGGESLIRHNRIHIGTAVAVEGGLLTVVVHDTDTTPLAQIALDNKEMIARARVGRSRPSDFEGSTFTVSNLGAFQVEHFIAIINPPEAAIMAVGTAQQVPVVKDGELSIGWRMKATISADHRVTDGAEAAQFMQHFKALMEEPIRLLL